MTLALEADRVVFLLLVVAAAVVAVRRRLVVGIKFTIEARSVVSNRTRGFLR